MTTFRGLPWLHIWAGRKSFGQFCSSTLPCTVSQANSPTVCRFTGGAALDVFGVLFYHLDLEQRYTVPRLLFTSFLQLVMLVLALKESMRNVVSESLGHLLAVDQDRQTSATLCRYATIVSMHRSSLPHRCKMMQTFTLWHRRMRVQPHTHANM